MTPEELFNQRLRDRDFCVRVLYRASKDAWICGDDAEADGLATLAHQTWLDMTPPTPSPDEVAG